MSRPRVLFRLALGIALVWSAYPAVAAAIAPASTADPSAVGAQPSAAPRTVELTTTSTTLPAAAVVPPPGPSTTIAAPAPVPAAPPSVATAAPVAVPATTLPVTVAPIASSTVAAELAPELATAMGCPAPPGALLAATNVDRRAHGLPDLCADAQLDQIAQSWATWMAQHHLFQHQDLAVVVRTTPFTAMAENILSAASSTSVAGMEALWMASPGHRDHILDGRYRAAGTGTAVGDDGRVYAVVDFGGS